MSDKPQTPKQTKAAPRMRYLLQVDPAQRAAWERVAELEGRPLAQWIRYVLDREAERTLTGSIEP